eukprot:904112-Rhodomonas_salina.1
MRESRGKENGGGGEEREKRKTREKREKERGDKGESMQTRERIARDSDLEGDFAVLGGESVELGLAEVGSEALVPPVVVRVQLPHHRPIR